MDIYIPKNQSNSLYLNNYFSSTQHFSISECFSSNFSYCCPSSTWRPFSGTTRTQQVTGRCRTIWGGPATSTERINISTVKWTSLGLPLISGKLTEETYATQSWIRQRTGPMELIQISTLKIEIPKILDPSLGVSGQLLLGYVFKINIWPMAV